MMSAPDRVAVDLPGATGTQVTSSASAENLAAVAAASDQQHADGGDDRSGGGPSPPTDVPEYTSAWTIGSTDGRPLVNLQAGMATLGMNDSSGHHPNMSLADALRGTTPSPPPHPVSSDPRRNSLPPGNGTAGLAALSQNLTPSGSHISRPGVSGASAAASDANRFKSMYQDRLFNQPSQAVEAVLAASCEAMGFDIAEMWLRTGPKTHQLTNSHLRPTALEDSVRNELVDVYYGDRSSERTHRLSPALCKRAKEAMDVVWVTAHTEHGAEALRCSISDVRTAVAIPVCHEMSRTNITIIFFSIRRAIMRPAAVEFLVHMALSAAVASVNSLAEDVMVDESPKVHDSGYHKYYHEVDRGHGQFSQSEHVSGGYHAHPSISPLSTKRHGVPVHVSVTGANLDLKWGHLKNIEYLTDGGNNWIHTAVLNGRPVVVKTLKPECQDLAIAINEIEGELEIHSKLDHPNIVSLIGAGNTSRGVRFVVLERLDGGSLTQMLGYDTRIRDRRRRFWKKKQFSYLEVLKCARSIADALAYCHGRAIPGSMVLHRDLKPDNIGFTLDGTVKLIDFGLARIVENASPELDEVYEMSGETGSLRYMAPEVADTRPYNHKADVYSFGIILWELVAYKKPYDGLNREQFYNRVVHGGERPPINKKWPEELVELMENCWSLEVARRPSFAEIVDKLDELLTGEKGGTVKKKTKNRISALIDRHSTWF